MGVTLRHGMLGQDGEMLKLRSPWGLGKYVGLVRDDASVWGCLYMTDDSHAGCQGGVGHSHRWVLGAVGVEMIGPVGVFKQRGDALGS